MVIKSSPGPEKMNTEEFCIKKNEWAGYHILNLS